mgnify:CR=1 FL=1|jgi:hypothetical protein
MDDKECAICLETFTEHSLLYPQEKKGCFNFKRKEPPKIVVLPCGHRFHYECIAEVKNRKCPLCRQYISYPNLCNGNHINGSFYLPFYKKDGTCRFCKKFSFKSALIQSIEQ